MDCIALQTTGDATVLRFPRTAPRGLTAAEIRELHQVAGYRVVVDAAPDVAALGQFAMLYADGLAWASWAVSREAGAVVVWNCVTLHTLGTYASVRAALAALPQPDAGRGCVGPGRASAEVIMFPGADRRPAPPRTGPATLHQ